MNTAFNQRGMSTLGILCVLLIAGFIMLCAAKLLPVYIEGWTVGNTMTSTIERQNLSGKSVREIRKVITRQFDMNRVEGISAKEVKISRQKGHYVVDATYESRVPLIYNIDVVVKFDTFIYQISASRQEG